MLNSQFLRSKYRKERKLLGLCSCSSCEDREMSKGFPAWALIGLVALGLIIAVCVISRSAHAEEYTDTQIVNAIYKSEGGNNAKYPYGIRSMRCSSIQDCRRVCLNTVRANKRRFRHANPSVGFIAYLGSKYCPTKGANLSKAEKEKNQYWLKNVMFYLKKDA